MIDRLIDRCIDRVPYAPWIWMTARGWARAWFGLIVADDPE